MPGTQHVGRGRLVRGRVVAQYPGARALRVQVDDQNSVAGLRRSGRESEGDRRLADTAFLVQQCSNPTHRGHRVTLRSLVAPATCGDAARIGAQGVEWYPMSTL